MNPLVMEMLINAGSIVVIIPIILGLIALFLVGAFFVERVKDMDLFISLSDYVKKKYMFLKLQYALWKSQD